MTKDQLNTIIREVLQEVTSEKQRRYMCAMMNKSADERPEGLSQAEAEEMCKSEVKEELDERCQKGYKTHETRKTKTMYGKTYRNCVKAEQLELDEKKKKRKKKKRRKAAKKKDDRCTRIAKRKYDVWPSAYASGAVVRCRAGKIWKGVKEEVTLNEAEDNLPAKIRKALKDEGGAAGMKALKEHTDGTEKDIKKAISDMDDVGLHEHGDYILHDGKEVHIKKTKDNE
tara:strand:+ start:112 stop:795 length:684 start_codon:yes stop_codon:yes gene_type:complete